MFVDARTVPDGSLIETDVCIVGAGAAGITIARALRDSTLRVALLESGGLTPDEPTQALYEGAVRARPYFPLGSAQTRTRYFGGTTNEWTGECRPLDALDFEARDWVPDSGWPFGLLDLQPFYEEAQALCQLGPFAYTSEDWDDHGARPIVFRSDRIRSHAFHYSPPTRFGQAYGHEIRHSPNVVAYLWANVVDVETPTSPDRVSRLRVACLSGSGFRVRARLFILAAGGIENARLLLAANTVQAAGLGNAHDQVGRYFMEHLYLDRAASILTRPGHISDFYTSGLTREGRRVRGIVSLSSAVQRGERLTNFAAVLDEEEPYQARAWCRSLLEDLRRRQVPPGTLTLLRNTIPLIGAAVAARLKLPRRRPFPRLYLVKNIMEQAPNPESRIVLGPDRDSLGLPRVVLDWRLTAIDKQTAHRAHEILDEELSRAGVGRLRSAMGRPRDPWPTTLRGARHHMGTTRMHPDPRRGVVDANGRVHGIANLYVAGSSVFPTSGSANPTLTIVALALRLARHVTHRVSAGAPA